MVEDLVAVGRRHDEVEQHDLRHVLGQVGHRLCSGVGRNVGEACVVQRLAQDVPADSVVIKKVSLHVDDQRKAAAVQAQAVPRRVDDGSARVRPTLVVAGALRKGIGRWLVQVAIGMAWVWAWTRLR